MKDFAVRQFRRAIDRYDRRDERGMVAVWTAVSLVAFIVIVGIGVDFAGHARAEQEARAAASEAARAAGQYLEVGSGRARPDAHQAVAAANSAVASSGFSGSAQVTGGQIHVSVSGEYQTQFLSIIGINSLSVSGSATVEAKTTIDGSEE